MDKKVIYYKDELKDEFSGAEIIPRKIDENYKYFHKNPIWLILAFLFNCIILPIKILFPKIKFGVKYIGKEKLKKVKNSGFFVYVNHTQIVGDPFIPSIPILPKRNYFIVNPENVSMPGVGNSIQMLGAIPIPSNKKAMKNFLNKIETVINNKYAITIYPEAHIWPYYTKIRPFKSVSFSYPVDLNVPAFCMTNTYYKKENSNKIKMITYIDGPFFPNKNLNRKEQKEELRNRIYEQMKERSKNNNVEYIKYVKVEENAENINDSKS